MAYCEVGDLLLGDVETGNINLQKWVDQAAEEIDVQLGRVYKIPIAAKTNLPWSGVIAPRDLLVLKQINLKMATARLILTTSAAEEEASQHAYGRGLLNESLAALGTLVNGNLELPSLQKVVTDSDERKLPSIHNEDSSSLVVGWEQMVMHRDSGPFGPGPKPYVRPGGG